jgi:homoserine dehydrogenase
VLATVAGVFATHEVSIATVRQSGRDQDAKLVIVTHGAPDAHLAATVESLSRLDIVRSIASVLRVEGGV